MNIFCYAKLAGEGIRLHIADLSFKLAIAVERSHLLVRRTSGFQGFIISNYRFGLFDFDFLSVHCQPPIDPVQAPYRPILEVNAASHSELLCASEGANIIYITMEMIIFLLLKFSGRPSCSELISA